VYFYFKNSKTSRRRKEEVQIMRETLREE